MGKRVNTAVWMEKHNRWQVNVQKDGKRRSFTSSKPGRAGQREANSKADAWLDEGVRSTRDNLSKLFVPYLEELKMRTSRSHWRNVEYRWRIWGYPVVGNVKPGNLTDQHIQDVLNAAYSDGKLSKKSLINIRSDLTAFAKWLRKNKLTTYHPEEITIPKSAKVGIRRILQPENIITLFSVDTTMRYGKRVRDKYINAYRFQVLTGLRPGELVGMMQSDVSGTRVNLARSINIYNEITSGKNDNAIRGFKLTITAKNVLDDQMGRTNSIYVFGITSEPNYRKRWRVYCESNDIPYVSPYEMRHTFVSIVQGLPEGWVQALVGHSKNMDTFGTYGHDVSGMDNKIAASVEGVFRDILTGGA